MGTFSKKQKIKELGSKYTVSQKKTLMQHNLTSTHINRFS